MDGRCLLAISRTGPTCGPSHCLFLSTQMMADQTDDKAHGINQNIQEITKGAFHTGFS